MSASKNILQENSLSLGKRTDLKSWSFESSYVELASSSSIVVLSKKASSSESNDRSPFSGSMQIELFEICFYFTNASGKI